MEYKPLWKLKVDETLYTDCERICERPCIKLNMGGEDALILPYQHEVIALSMHKGILHSLDITEFSLFYQSFDKYDEENEQFQYKEV